MDPQKRSVSSTTTSLASCSTLLLLLLAYCPSCPCCCCCCCCCIAHVQRQGCCNVLSVATKLRRLTLLIKIKSTVMCSQFSYKHLGSIVCVIKRLVYIHCINLVNDLVSYSCLLLLFVLLFILIYFVYVINYFAFQKNVNKAAYWYEFRINLKFTRSLTSLT